MRDTMVGILGGIPSAGGMEAVLARFDRLTRVSSGHQLDSPADYSD